MTERDQDADGDDAAEAADAKRPPPRTVAEWTTLAVSVAVAAVLVGLALYEQFVDEELPGARVSIALAVEEAEERDGFFYVPFDVANAGAQPAESVVVVFEVRQGEETVEESTADVAFLPINGAVGGELVTRYDPATTTIESRVATLQIP